LILYPRGRQGDYIIPASVTEIAPSAFYDCIGLTSIFIPASITEIDKSAFAGCENLTAIDVHLDNPTYASENGVLLSKYKTKLILYPHGRQGDYIIPASVTEIPRSAFYDRIGLTSVIIPDSVVKISETAFYYCSNLTSVTIPNSVKIIEEYAFGSCYNLKNVTIPASVVEIGKNAFYEEEPPHFTVDPDNPVYESVKGKLKRKRKTKK